MVKLRRRTKNVGGLRFPREQGFFDKSVVVRLFLAAVFAVCFFIVLHFRETHVDVLELNSIADRYIVSQVDFEFYDEEETIILRQEANRDIGKIYKLDMKEISQRRIEFEKHLINDKNWRKRVEHSTFDEMYKGVDSLDDALTKVRFSDARTLQKEKQHRFSLVNHVMYVPANIDESIVLPDRIWDYLEKIAFVEDIYQKGTVDFMMSYFNDKTWKFVEDKDGRRELREEVLASVPNQYTKVAAGDRIIDSGEKVMSRHLIMLQAMKNAISCKRNLLHPWTISGSVIITLLITTLCGMYLRARFPDILMSSRKLFLVCLIILFTLGFAKATEHFLVSTTSNVFDMIRYPLLLPFAAILLCSLMNVEIAIFSSALLMLVFSMTLAVNHGFLIMNSVAVLIVILNSHHLHSRKDIFIVCLKVWLGCVILVVALQLYNNTGLGYSIIADLVSIFVFMVFTSVFVVGFLALIESVFPIMTDAVLMEYIDSNNELLSRLALEAAGTYQHSIAVGNLSEAAAQAIGANSLFCRVAAMYHDIGKLRTPYYFTENQQRGVNMHQLLTPVESAQVIIAHVCEGVAMGRKGGLPEQFIDIIKEHHGTTYAYYFYHSQLELMGGDRSLVLDSDFRYSGPRPRSKESAIIMIADSLEAASRSLNEINEDTVEEILGRIVKEKTDDRQLDECMLTFEELGIVKRALIKTLVTASHRRIKYDTSDSDD